MNYGKEFKKIRIDHKATLKQVAQGISQMTISRFEQGNQGMDINHLDTMLKTMGVSMIEFIGATSDDDRIDNFNSHIMKHYFNSDDAKLLDEFNIQNEKYKSSKSNIDFEHLASIANLYYDLTGKNLLSLKRLSKVFDTLFMVEYWGPSEIRYFGEVTALLNPVQLLTIEREICKQMPMIRRSNYTLYVDAWTSLLNGYLCLIESDVRLATSFCEEIMRQDTAAQLVQVQIRRYFLTELLKFKTATTKTEKISYEANMTSTVTFLNTIGSNDEANQYMQLIIQHCR